MARAAEMVRQYVRAGYAKIHLDASMPCADDPLGPLADTVAAARTADLAAAAEAAAVERPAGAPAPLYVVGTEVPPPGGQAGDQAGPAVTRVADAERTLALVREAFARRGLERAWERVIALVVQPGVEFGDDAVFPLPAGIGGRAQGPRRGPGPRLRGALHGLPGRGRPAGARRGPLRHPQGGPRADLRLSRGGLRPGGDRARAPGAGAGRTGCPGVRPGPGRRDAPRPPPLEALVRRRGRGDGAPAAALQPQRPLPLLLDVARRCRTRCGASSRTWRGGASRGGW